MRILVVNQYFHPDQSATAQLLTECCEDLAAHHEVYVVTGRPSYNPVEATASRGLVSRERHGPVRLLRVWSTGFDRSSLPKRLTNYGTYLASSLAGAFDVARPDVVMALTDPPPVGLIGAITAGARRVPFVLVTKDIFPDTAIRMGLLSNPALIRSLRAMSRSLLRNARVVVSIGRDMTRRLGALGVPSGKIRLIRDWADGSAVRPLAGLSPVRHRHGWEGKFVVMHSGNVGHSQSLGTLVEAADRLREVRDVVFAIVGDGASKGALQAEAGRRGLDNVQFLPYQPKASLSESLGAADLHLVSLRRGLAGFIVPSKVYGIMAAGRPFIVAAEPDAEPALIAGEHGCGVLVEPDDPGALADAVVRLRGDPLALLKMGRRGRAALEEYFDRPIASAAYRRMLEEVVEGHSETRWRGQKS